MGLTLSETQRVSLGNANGVLYTAAFDSSYPTGGESLTAADLGFTTILFLQATATLGMVFQYDYTNAKLLAYAQGVIVGAAGSATIDDFAISAGPGAATTSVVGLGSTLGSSTLNLGALVECNNTNDLSSIVGVRVFVIGF